MHQSYCLCTLVSLTSEIYFGIVEDLLKSKKSIPFYS